MEMSPAPEHVDSLENSSVHTSEDGNNSLCDPTSMEASMCPDDDAEEKRMELQIDTGEVQEVPSSEATTNVAPPPTPAPLVPCLRGKMTYVGGVVHCEGKWAMSVQAHDIPGQTSDFKFQLKKADDNGSFFPVNGIYEGWFHLKQAPPNKGHIKVEDKNMHLTFTSVDSQEDRDIGSVGEGGYVIAGEGENKFGKFRLRGGLSGDGEVEMYREYFHLNTVVPITPKKVRSVSEKKPPLPPPAPLSSTPREGRVRKSSVLLQEYSNSFRPPSPPALQHSQSYSSVASTVTQERTQRLVGWTKRALELLKELTKHPAGVWFLEPVDYVALNLPDYPRIIKTPMDLGTVRGKVEGGAYAGIEAFGEDVRLVFRNAMQFNTSIDHPVHAAARSLLQRFEERFKSLLRQLYPDEYVDAAGAGVRKSMSGAVAGAAAVGGMSIPKKARSSSAAYPSSSSNKKLGIRPNTSISSMAGGYGGGYVLPPVMDSSAHTILEMQKMMQSMQEEIKVLRGSLREKEVRQRVLETKVAAPPTLSHEEKTQLIKSIHKLPAHKMDEVLDIIHSSLPPQAAGDQIEVPLDSLDTYTLRRLQDFVDEHNSEQKKKRSFGAASPTAAGARTAGRGGGGDRKKRRVGGGGQSGGMDLGGAFGGGGLTGDDLDLFDVDEEDPLFSAQPAAGGDDAANSQSAWGVNAATEEGAGARRERAEGEEEEDNLWSEAAAELRARRTDWEGEDE